MFDYKTENIFLPEMRLSSRRNNSLLNCRNNSGQTAHLASKILTVCPSEFDLCWSISEKVRSLKLKNIFFIIYKMAALPQWQFFLPPMQSMSKITKILVTTWKNLNSSRNPFEQLSFKQLTPLKICQTTLNTT